MASSVSALHADATRAFLQRNHAAAIVKATAALPAAISTSSSSEDHTAKLLILRITALSTLYTSHRTDSVSRQEASLAVLASASASASPPAAGDAAAALKLADAAQMLSMDKPDFVAHLWSDTLAVCNKYKKQTPGSAEGPAAAAPAAPSLHPADEATLLLALAVPANVLATLIFASLKLDEGSAPGGSVAPSAAASKMSASTPSLLPSLLKGVTATDANKDKVAPSSANHANAGLVAARCIAEWFLAAYSNGNTKHGSEGASKNAGLDEAYRRVMQLYCVHLIGLRSGEWEYASETIGYSVLDPHTKQALMNELHAAHAQTMSARDRARDLAKQLELERKASMEKQKAAVAAANGNGHTGAPNGASPRQKGANGSAAASRSSLSASTPALSRPTAPVSRSTSKLAPNGQSNGAAAGSLGAKAETDPDHRLTSDLIRAANNDVRRRRERSQDETDSTSPSTNGPSTSDVALQERSSSAPRRQQATGMSTMLSTYLLQASLTRYLSIILFVLALAYPRLRARWNGSASSRTGAGSAASAVGGAVVGAPGLVGSLVRRLWDTVRMGTQVTYL
ncbi:hypothetical protein OC835_003399 [Tilletia horrida]|nr:hypothetical protein OC835_003399 [Tilletia horrida]